MSVEINKDIDNFQESVVLGLTAKQLAASVLSVLVGGVIVFLGLTVSAYIAIPVVAPIALSGFYSFNGMSFMQMMKKKIQFMFKAKPLVYKSTESVDELKQTAAKVEEEKRKVEAETDKKDEFTRTKKKMIRILVISIMSALVAIGIACGCKFL